MGGFSIRSGCDADIGILLEVERRAAGLLLDHGAHDLFAMHSLAAADLARGIRHGVVRVAERDGQPVGFALCNEVDGQAHLFEMDVLPEHGRCGIGTALLASTWDFAVAHGWTVMTLTTLRDVPWNGPFYLARGFAELPLQECGKQLAEIIARERMLGFPMELRMVMRRKSALAA
ncbi:MAG: GNAT family N-acetyltransferase [Pseudoxanthomonas sp.]